MSRHRRKPQQVKPKKTNLTSPNVVAEPRADTKPEVSSAIEPAAVSVNEKIDRFIDENESSIKELFLKQSKKLARLSPQCALCAFRTVISKVLFNTDDQR